ncbi:peptide deformylase [candidate division KSB1 bacterium]|nr:peptide deformylase [candidate division KSB1 bacterium]
MAIRQILIYGDPGLHEKAETVDDLNDDIQELIDDMFQTMFEAKGVGLAATQIGVNKSVVVIDMVEDEDIHEMGTMLSMVNMEIHDKTGMTLFEEGCLSIPGVTADIDRPEAITVKFVNRKGDWEEFSCDGLLARIIQHEYDHLQGILFVQHLSASEKKKLLPQLRKLAKGVEA